MFVVPTKVGTFFWGKCGGICPLPEGLEGRRVVPELNRRAVPELAEGWSRRMSGLFFWGKGWSSSRPLGTFLTMFEKLEDRKRTG